MARRAGKSGRRAGKRPGVGASSSSATRRPAAQMNARRRARLEERFRAATVEHQAGRLAAAEAGYREVLEAAPSFPGAALNYALLARATGRVELALELARQAVASQPDAPDAHNTLANLLSETGHADEAITAWRAAIALAPGHVNARLNLAAALRRAGDPEAAVAVFRELSERHSGEAGLRTSLGAALFDAGAPRGAIEVLQGALALAPDDPDALTELGLAHLDVGEFEEAARCLRRALDASPVAHAHAWLSYAKTRRFRPDEPDDQVAIEAAERAVEQLRRGGGGESGTERGDVHFALGKMYDDLGEHERAFEHWRRGNEVLRRHDPFDPDQTRRRVDALMAAFDAAWFERVRGCGNDSPRPVFIVGMPRSGTSLVEQILASHPAIHAAGELLLIPRLAARLFGGGDLVETAAALTPESLGEAARGHLESLARLAERAGRGDALRVTDKLPENHDHLGLIAALFPDARIVHVRRDPMDVCFSNWVTRFRDGHGWTHDFDTLANEYAAYERLMRHWRAVGLPTPMREQSYEALVASFERESRALIEFCGLEWDERCLDFHRTERAVHTASGWQVRQPLYSRSVERWRNYAPQLEPLRAALARAGCLPA